MRERLKKFIRYLQTKIIHCTLLYTHVSLKDVIIVKRKYEVTKCFNYDP